MAKIKKIVAGMATLGMIALPLVTPNITSAATNDGSWNRDGRDWRNDRNDRDWGRDRDWSNSRNRGWSNSWNRGWGNNRFFNQPFGQSKYGFGNYYPFFNTGYYGYYGYSNNLFGGLFGNNLFNSPYGGYNPYGGWR